MTNKKHTRKGKTIDDSRSEVESRRKRVLELNNAFKTHQQIADITGYSIQTIESDLMLLERSGANVKNVREVVNYRLKQKVEPDKKMECPTCKGKGRHNGEECLRCLGSCEVDTFYGVIMKQRNLETKKAHLMRIRLLMQYLRLTDFQDLLTWYQKHNTHEEDLLYFERKVGDGFVVKELQEKRKNKVVTQQSIITAIKTAYELNGVNDLPWKRVRGKILPPENRKPDQEQEKAYTIEQIKILYNNSNPTYKALIAFFMSGARVGGFYQRIDAADLIKYPEKERYLRIKDLTDPLEGLTDNQRRDFLFKKPDYEETPVYEMNIYSEDLNKRGDPDHYRCWSTPEFYYLVNLTLAQRQRDGELGLDLQDKPFNIEHFPPDTPVFRMEYGDPKAKPMPLDFDAAFGYFRVRRKKYLYPMKKRVKMFQGFRSYVDTVLEHNIKPALTLTERQWLMGRELPAMGKHYDAWSKLDQLEKFWGGLEWLTIGEMREKFLGKTIKDKDQKLNEMEMEKMRNRQMEWAMALKTDEVMKKNTQNEQELNFMKRFVIAVAKKHPDILEDMQKELPDSSLPSESKKRLIDVTKEEHTSGNDDTDE